MVRLKDSTDRILLKIYELIRILNSHTNYLISSKSKDTNLIEFTLDSILDTCVVPEGEELFNKLCNYYETVNLENALEYRKIYSELFEEEKVLKK